MTRLFDLIPDLAPYSHDHSFGASVGGGRDESGTWRMGHVAYPDLLARLIDTLDDLGFYDGTVDHYAAFDLRNRYLDIGEPAVRDADYLGVVNALKQCASGERWCDGNWKHVIETGYLVALLRRLQVLWEGDTHRRPG